MPDFSIDESVHRLKRKDAARQARIAARRPQRPPPPDADLAAYSAADVARAAAALLPGVASLTVEPTAGDLAAWVTARNADGTYAEKPTAAEIAAGVVGLRVAEARAAALAWLDAIEAELFTDRPAQAEKYAEKERQARAYGASRQPADAPMLAREAALESLTLDNVAARVLRAADAYRALAAETEPQRRRLAYAPAATLSEFQAIEAAARASIAAALDIYRAAVA